MQEEPMKNEKEIDLVQLTKDLWKLRKRVIKWGFIGAIVGVVVALSTPKEYTTRVKLIAESNSSQSSSGAGALASMMGVNIQTPSSELSANIYPEIFTSTPFLLKFAKFNVPFENDSIPFWKYILKEQKMPWWSYVLSFPSYLIGWISSIGEDKKELGIENSQEIRNAFCYLFSKNINITYDKKNNIIDIESRMQSPEIGYIVADSLYSKLQNYVMLYKTQKARQVVEMSKKMKAEAKAKFFEADSIYSYTADRNLNLRSFVAQARVDKLKDERDLSFGVYQQISNQVEMAEIKLLEAMPIATIIEPAQLPLQPSKPRKLFMVIVFGVLFAAGYVGVYFVKTLVKR